MCAYKRKYISNADFIFLTYRLLDNLKQSNDEILKYLVVLQEDMTAFQFQRFLHRNRPVMVASGNSTFFLFGYHGDNIRVIFQNHLPKVIRGSWQWPLGSNIVILFSRIDYFNITGIDVVLVFSKRNTC